MNKLEYPYYNKYYKLNRTDFLKTIKNFEPTILKTIPKEMSKHTFEKYNNSYFIIKENYAETSHINNITDYFSESVRVKCKFADNVSPYDYWTKNKDTLIQKQKQKHGKVTIYNLREAMYFNTKLCNNFRISVALTILRTFKPDSWLDISAGWGDRLLSAIFYKIKLYVSCDPNLDLHKYYDLMIDTFVPKNKTKNFMIHKNGFLQAPFEQTDFDLVFSSPPFFTLERYSNFSENSITQFNTEKDWCDYFFIPSLIRAYNLLKKGGHFILYMGGSDYVMKAMHRLSNVMEYKGIIYFYDNKPRGMYVWKKTSKTVISTL
jgi:hypothetical protein